MFAKKFLNCWGLGRGKKLLIHYDEKWFWGLVLRRDAKACDSLGLEATVMKAYHRNHINKVMGIAFVGFAFTDCIESRGKAIKLGFFVQIVTRLQKGWSKIGKRTWLFVKRMICIW